MMMLALLHAAAALQGVGRRGPCAVRRASACVSMALEWEECGGCQVLRPQQGRPRAMVHFLGGVAVSPAPQVAYRHLLEQLSERGYLVVATPYTVDFDYGKPVAEIRDKFDAARALLGEEYEELPLLGLGHSLGALMQTLLFCQHAPYTEACAGLALVSWNNKPVSDGLPLLTLNPSPEPSPDPNPDPYPNLEQVSDAIPLFEELFVPALAPLAGPLEQAATTVPLPPHTHLHARAEAARTRHSPFTTRH